MKKNYLIAGTIIAIAVIGFFVIQNKNGGGQVACTMEAKLCPDGSSVGRQGPNCEFAACPTGELCEGVECPAERQQEIRVSFPKPNDAIGLPLTITGEARVFENVLGYRLSNANGKKLIEGFGETKAPAGQVGPFTLTVNYPDPKTETGTLELIEFAIGDGTESEKQIIPVTFAPVESTEVKVYFGNINKDPKSLSCETTYPTTRRVAKTSEVATEAIAELLRGVTSFEGQLGFITSLNPNVTLQSLTIENGVAKVDFDEMLQTRVAGSCRIAAIRSQIEQTLKQFPDVQRVIISINGRSEDILQP